MPARKCEDCKSEEATFKVASATIEKLIGDRCIPPYALSLAWAGAFYPSKRERRTIKKRR